MRETIDKRILFVDDEPKVLRALRRGLRKKTSEWHLDFADGPREALELMSGQAYDVVVSDVTMPRMDGVAFLGEVRKVFPDTVRVLMSGTAEGQTLMRAVPVAHRFLSKPWEVSALMDELERAFALRAFMGDAAIRTLIGGLDRLPVLPRVYTELCEVLEKPQSRLDDIVEVVEKDPSVVARLLQIVNSAFFAPPRPLHSAAATIRYLGTSLLKSLLLNSEVFRSFDKTRLPKGLSLSQLQNHAMLTAKIAGELAGPIERERATTAGLLHNIGKLVLADRLPTRWATVLAETNQSRRALADVEFDHFGCTYAEVGGYLLGIWGLPQELVEAVAHHCDPMRRSESGLNLVAVVHLASVLASQELGACDAEFDDELLQELDGARSMDAWRSMTASIAQRPA